MNFFPSESRYVLSDVLKFFLFGALILLVVFFLQDFVGKGDDMDLPVKGEIMMTLPMDCDGGGYPDALVIFYKTEELPEGIIYDRYDGSYKGKLLMKEGYWLWKKPNGEEKHMNFKRKKGGNNDSHNKMPILRQRRDD